MTTADIQKEPDGPKTSVQPYQQIILFGDSITQQSGNQDLGFGFAPAFQADYIRRLDVINRGLSGYNTRQAKRCLPWIMPTTVQARVRLVIIFFGANDACVSGHPQHVPLEEYTSNLAAITRDPLITVHQHAKVLIIGPPPVNEHQFLWLDRTAEHTKTYADAIRETAKELGVPLVDLWLAFMTRAGWKEGEPLLGKTGVPGSERLEETLSDGLHFTPTGYQVMYEEVTRVIREQLADCVPDAFPAVLPPYDQY